jgi:hypothetical protein
MKRQCIALSLVITFGTAAFAGIDSKKAAYRGGSLPLDMGIEAKIDLTNPTVFRFLSKKTAAEIPYDKVQSIEYGQNAGRRVGAAIGWTIAAGPLGLLALMSKKRKHIVSLTWLNEAGKTEAAVFEVRKRYYSSCIVRARSPHGKTDRIRISRGQGRLAWQECRQQGQPKVKDRLSGGRARIVNGAAGDIATSSLCGGPPRSDLSSCAILANNVPCYQAGGRLEQREPTGRQNDRCPGW